VSTLVPARPLPARINRSSGRRRCSVAARVAMRSDRRCGRDCRFSNGSASSASPSPSRPPPSLPQRPRRAGRRAVSVSQLGQPGYAGKSLRGLALGLRRSRQNCPWAARRSPRTLWPQPVVRRRKLVALQKQARASVRMPMRPSVLSCRRRESFLGRRLRQSGLLLSLLSTRSSLAGRLLRLPIRCSWLSVAAMACGRVRILSFIHHYETPAA
jgi:hypothetical protein